MSVRALTWALDQKTGSPISKLVLLKLADAANDSDGQCWPSRATIAEECELSFESVKRHIKLLADQGLLEVYHRKLSSVHSSNLYRLPFKRGVGSDRPQGGVSQTPGVGSDRPPNHNKEPELNLSPIVPEQIYDLYPLKAAKPKAIAAIKKALAKYPAKLLLEKTREFAAARNGDLEFCPMPTTWFNQERFNDEPSTWVRQKPKQPKPYDPMI